MLTDGLSAKIKKDNIPVLPIFKLMQRVGTVSYTHLVCIITFFILFLLDFIRLIITNSIIVRSLHSLSLIHI